MKKFSLIGLLLGAVLGIAVVMVFGKWLFWLGTGLAIGLFLGAAQARRSQVVNNSITRREASF
ncbi:MAG TPA: hypothetical protein VFB76_02225 [Candidatus Angelobacter sp.]|nr:hypothetical protein [Candidatus Angelobacter sp.]